MRRRLVSIVVCACAMTASAQQELVIVDTIAGTYIDISQSGSRLHLADDEERRVSALISGPVVEGQTFVVANNGGLGFGILPSDELSPINEPIPSLRAFGGLLTLGDPEGGFGTTGGQSLLPYWDDLGNTIGDVFYEQTGDRLIVQWDKPLDGTGPDDWTLWGDATDPRTFVRFQVQVFDQPEVLPRSNFCFAQYLYRQVEGLGARGGGATIGYQDGPGGFNDVQWSFDEAGAVRSGTVLTICTRPAAVILADSNCDTRVDFLDIDAFTLALSGPDLYHEVYPLCQYRRNDVNRDGRVNFDDINQFVCCLINGDCRRCVPVAIQVGVAEPLAAPIIPGE